jgi:hypothetical protein
MRASDPCGGCDIATYCVTGFLNGLDQLGHCQSKRDASRVAPRCKQDSSRICVGAAEFIKAYDFPMTEDEIAERRRYLTEEV